MGNCGNGNLFLSRLLHCRHIDETGGIGNIVRVERLLNASQINVIIAVKRTNAVSGSQGSHVLDDTILHVVGDDLGAAVQHGTAGLFVFLICREYPSLKPVL